MNNFFLYNNVAGIVELNVPEILLIKEFADLMLPERNICSEDPKGELHLRAFREFTYMFLAIYWNSPYADYSELEKHLEALKDARITEDEFNDPIFRCACRKYRSLLDSNRSIKMLQAALNTVDKFIDYFNNIDPEERDPLTGKPIFKVKDIMTEISSLSKVHDELSHLEQLVKKDIVEQSTIRGGAQDGFLPTF